MTFDSRHDLTHLYFVTATVCGWKHLFADPTYADIVLGSLDWSRREGRMALFAFVLMPSHLHAIVKPEDRVIAHNAPAAVPRGDVCAGDGAGSERRTKRA